MPERHLAAGEIAVAEAARMDDGRPRGMSRAIVAVAAAALMLGLTACSPHSTTLRSSPPALLSTSAGSATGHGGSAGQHADGGGGAGGGLVVVHDPGRVTGTLHGRCHARDGGLLPDSSCTPGAVDPAVTQADLASTICVPGYSSSVRPPESQTEAFKWKVAELAYGQHEVSGELDHLVPLELGGANDARNLWVEAGPIPNPKDALENALHRAVCAGSLSLRTAQQQIARDWITAAAAVGVSVARPSVVSSATRGAAWCTTSASYSARYADWDVVVHSSQADQDVTASGGGYSHTWHTDADGYADIYLRGPTAGDTISVTVGAARCTVATR